MINHICQTCWTVHELSDDYHGVIHVCPKCEQTSEVTESRAIQSICIPEEPGAKPSRWAFLFEKIDLSPNIKPASPMYTQAILHCPYCRNTGQAILLSSGWNFPFTTMLSTGAWMIFYCCVIANALERDLRPIGAISFLCSILFFIISLVLVIKVGINSYQPHCINCGHWFR